jgi:hypothetical protein
MQLKFNSFTKNIDGQEYCSEVETLAENMIEGNEQDATIVYPAPGQWATLRAENYRLSTDGLSIVLPYPIYKIVSLKIAPYGMDVGTGAKWEVYKNKNGELAILDIAPYVVLQDEWNALQRPNPHEYFTKQFETLSKGNTLNYSVGNKSIKILTDLYKFGGGVFQGEYPAFIGVVSTALKNLKNADEYLRITPTTEESLAEVIEQEYLPALAGLSQDPRLWEFQIEYIPMTSATKMKAHKAEATTQAYTQVVNQRAEVNNAEAFGKYLHATAQKTGTEKLAIAKIYKRLEDVPPIGAVVNHNGERYRLIANTWNITNPFTFTVTHLLSKNWSSKSKHIAVDQKYRNWNIPFDSYIWRTIYYEEFIEIGEEITANNKTEFKYTDKCIADTFSTEQPRVQPLNSLFLYRGRGAAEYGVVTPTTTMAVGNSFIISATMQDNLSAGLHVSATDPEFCEEVLYPEPDGTLEYAQIILSPGIDGYSANEYPAALVHVNVPSDKVFSKYFYLDKDPGEAIKVSIQCHIIPNSDWVVIGNALAQTVPYISDKQRTFRLYALKQYIRDGVDKLDAETLYNARLIAEDNGLNLKYSASVWEESIFPSLIYPIEGFWIAKSGKFADIVLCNGTSLSFIDSLEQWFIDYGQWFKAWAITDEDNNLLIGSNDINKRTVYFNWKKTRSKK